MTKPVEPSPEGCYIVVSREGLGSGQTELEALRNLWLIAGNQRDVEIYHSSTLRKGAVWLDDEKYICWNGEHLPPTLIARMVNGKRLAVDGR